MRAMSAAVRVSPWVLFAAPAACLVSFVVGMAWGHRSPLPDPQRTALQVVHQEIERSYVEAIDPRELLDRAIGAMARLDDYSEYVPPSRVARFVEETTGTYEGVGVEPYFADDGVFVRIPFPGGPADRAGLLPGDRIDAIDDTAIATLSAQERARITGERLRGPADSTVRLRVHRSGEDRTIEVARGAVQKPSVKWQQFLPGADGLGYAYLAAFHPGCSKELEAALAELARAPSGLRALVFDLRGDGGGNLDECVAIARLFLKTGNIVTLRRRGSEVVESFDANGKSPYADLPLVLLVDAQTASASEVLAGALQDHHRAAIVGVETYGKGVVNTVFQWQNLDFRLKLTTAHYYTPSGRNLERDRKRHLNGDANGDSVQPPGGITPDRVVALDDGRRAAVQQALAGQPFAERHRDALAAWSGPRGLRLPGIVPPADDPQLAAAIEAAQARMAAAAGAGTGATTSRK